jgi:hypothetical protein
MAYTNQYTPTAYSAKDTAASGSDLKKLKGSDFQNLGKTGDFDRIKAELDKIEDGFNTVGTTKNVFAALTYDGFNETGNPHNIKNVEWVRQSDDPDAWKFCRVEFTTGQDGTPNNSTPPPDGANNGNLNGTLNADLNIQVTPFSNADNSAGFAGFVFATVTEITNYYTEIAFVQNGFDFDRAVWNQAFCLLVARN